MLRVPPPHLYLSHKKKDLIGLMDEHRCSLAPLKSPGMVAIISAMWRHDPEQRPTALAALQVRIHFIIVMIRWTGLAPWEFESRFQVALHLPS